MATGALSAHAETCSNSALKVRVGIQPSRRDLIRFSRLFPAPKCWANRVSPSGAILISRCHVRFTDRRFFRADSHSVKGAMDEEKRNDKEYGREDVSQHCPLLNRLTAPPIPLPTIRIGS